MDCYSTRRSGTGSEGNAVEAGSSVLASLLGQRVASEYVTIIDEGVGGGCFMPYDDEGVRKGRTVIVEGGILKNYLTSRQVACKLGIEVTGNGRAQDYAAAPIVRQTNYYMLPEDCSVEELIEDVGGGIYVTGKEVKERVIDALRAKSIETKKLDVMLEP